MINKKYFFDELENNYFMIPFDKRGEWSQFKDDPIDVGKYDEYMVDGIDKISFENPNDIVPEEIIEESIKNFEEFLNESTMSYYPGLSDDGTADALAGIKEDIYKEYNKLLRDKEKEVLKYGDDDNQKFYQKWMYANMITTLLQDGMYIEEDLIKRAVELYGEVLNDENIEEYRKDEKIPESFKEQVSETLEELKKVNIRNGRAYSPGFMEDEDVKVIHKDNEKEIEIIARDQNDTLVELLCKIKSRGNIGHTFDIVVEPDSKEFKKTFEWDGDGSDSIKNIKVNGVEYEGKKPKMI